ncbi:MAG TPA: squalene/phytoene synthase family protein, partial [Thermoanaerobaculia bacterium]
MNVDRAYAYCRRIAHQHGANFSVGFRFLPRRKRRAVYAAYAFCRMADDIADEGWSVIPVEAGVIPSEVEGSPSRIEAGDPSTSLGMTRTTTLDLLDEWQRELDAAYAGTPAHPITIALSDALQHFDIPKRAFVELIDGCRQDLVKTRYETFAELLHYCDLVASTISDISLSIFGYKSGEAIGYGRKLSTALQLTNGTRDVGD